MSRWWLSPLFFAALMHVKASEHPIAEDPRSVLVAVLNVREANSLDAPVQARLAQGDLVCVMAESGPWLRVAYLEPVHDETGDLERRMGFVHRGFVSSRMRSDQARYEEAQEYCRLAVPPRVTDDVV